VKGRCRRAVLPLAIVLSLLAGCEGESSDAEADDDDSASQDWTIHAGDDDDDDQPFQPEFQKAFAFFVAFKPFDAEWAEQQLSALRDTGTEWISVDIALAQDAWNSPTIFAVYDEPDEKSSIPHRYMPDKWHHTPSDDELVQFVELARELGFKIMFKPHIHPFDTGMYSYMDYNHNGEMDPDEEGTKKDPGWPGTVHMGSDVEWNVWFRNYTDILVHYLDLLEPYGIEQVCIGDELCGTYTRYWQWEKLIDDLRKRTGFGGALTCAFDWWITIEHKYRGLFDLAPLVGISHMDILDGILLAGLEGLTSQLVFEEGRKQTVAADIFAERFDPPGQPNGNRWYRKLDYVGINPYFPLTRTATPTYEQILAGWTDMPTEDMHLKEMIEEALEPLGVPLWLFLALVGLEEEDIERVNFVDCIDKFHEDIGKPMIFTEGPGYLSVDGATIFPANWYLTVADENQQIQRDAYLAVFETFWDVKYIYAYYWWDWVEQGPKGYSPYGKLAEDVLVEWYAKDW